MTDEDKNESADETVKPLSQREKLLALFAEWDANPLSDRESAKVSAVIESFRDDPFVLRDFEGLLDARFPPKPAALKVTRSVEYGVQNSIGGGADNSAEKDRDRHK